MNEFEQKLPQQAEAVVEQAENDAALTDALETAPEPMLDITMGDMETDLPKNESGSDDVLAQGDVTVIAESVSAQNPALAQDDASASEIEIPWGAVSLDSEAEETVDHELMQAEPAAAEKASEAAPEAIQEPLPIKRVWYVVHCYSGYENKVKKALERRIKSDGLEDYIFRVVVPIEREVEIREGQRKNIERRVFPGYILVEMMELVDRETLTAESTELEKKKAAKSDEVWYAIRNTQGVTGFVSSGDQQRPVPLRQEEVDKILKRMESEEPKVHVTYRVGQTVHIIDGPFADFRGSVDQVDMLKGKVRVLVSFFGRETPVELDLLQVEKV